GDLHGTQPITLRTAVYEIRTYGGVRGALRQFLAEPSTRLYDGFLFIPFTSFFDNLVIFFVCLTSKFIFMKVYTIQERDKLYETAKSDFYTFSKKLSGIFKLF
ncbi:hypothetical protein, partial [Flavobacterium yafengii]|uniref:hypothetical protein n=1 Tax=Flavobacterium yafengii TaxID=3041253 RepID=UPI0024A94BCD